MNTTSPINDTPLISVVMATYNGERFIKEAIDSILNQTYSDFEFIIVDDGSTDTTADLIHSYTDKRIDYVKKEDNSGIADSLNIGIAKAKGQYIARMDDDDVCMPNRLEKQLRAFQRNKNLIFCGSTVTNKVGQCLVTPQYHQDVLIKLVFSNPIFHPTALILKSVLQKKPYAPNAVPSEDYDLWSRLIFEGEFYQIQEPLLYCRIHQTSVTANRRKEQLQKNIIIATRIYRQLALVEDATTDVFLKIFTVHDYRISGHKLRGLTKWFSQLKQTNTNKMIFNANAFNAIANDNLYRFLESYFLNNNGLKKVNAFIYLPLSLKYHILKFYIARFSKLK